MRYQEECYSFRTREGDKESRIRLANPIQWYDLKSYAIIILDDDEYCFIGNKLSTPLPDKAQYNCHKLRRQHCPRPTHSATKYQDCVPTIKITLNDLEGDMAYHRFRK